MKPYIYISILAIAIVAVMLFALDQKFESDCDYFETLEFPTPTMKSLCPEHFESEVIQK